MVAGGTIVGMVVLLTVLAMTIRVPASVSGLAEVAQGVEAAVNDVIFFGVAVYFLATIETRLKRRRALHPIHPTIRSSSPG